jgi:uncharacterized protein YkwD
MGIFKLLPRLVIAAAVTSLLAFPLSALSQSIVGSQPSIAEQYLLAAANRERAALGLAQLQRDPALAQAALFHAREVAAHDEVSHEFPGEPDLSVRGARAGVHFSLISENVAEAPNAIDLHDMWMHSAGHRANLLDPEVNVMGVAVVERDGQLYAVEDFASTVESLSLTEQESTVAGLLERTAVNISTKTGATEKDARATCSMPTGYAGVQRPWYIMRYTASTLADLPSQLKSKLSTGKYHQAVVGACQTNENGSFSAYNIAVLLFP